MQERMQYILAAAGLVQELMQIIREEALLRGIDYCHLHGRKLYLTVNTLLKRRELKNSCTDHIRPYYCGGLTA